MGRQWLRRRSTRSRSDPDFSPRVEFPPPITIIGGASFRILLRWQPCSRKVSTSGQWRVLAARFRCWRPPRLPRRRASKPSNSVMERGNFPPRHRPKISSRSGRGSRNLGSKSPGWRPGIIGPPPFPVPIRPSAKGPSLSPDPISPRRRPSARERSWSSRAVWRSPGTRTVRWSPRPRLTASLKTPFAP